MKPSCSVNTPSLYAMFFAVCTNRNSGAFVGAAGCAATRGDEGAQSATNSSAANKRWIEESFWCLNSSSGCSWSWSGWGENRGFRPSAEHSPAVSSYSPHGEPRAKRPFAGNPRIVTARSNEVKPATRQKEMAPHPFELLSSSDLRLHRCLPSSRRRRPKPA